MVSDRNTPGAEAVESRPYHPALVALHWLMALMIIGMLTMGFLVLANTSNADPHKLTALRAHMIIGTTIFVLLILRIVLRSRTKLPQPATTGSRLLDRSARAVHIGFYVIVFLMAGSGMATALAAGLVPIVFGGSGDPLPLSFRGYPSLLMHWLLALLLSATIILHTLAAFYHHFVLRDGIFRRVGLSSSRRSVKN